MRLISAGTAILAYHHQGSAPIAIIRDPARAQAVLIAQGCRPLVAREVAYGLLSIEAAKRLGTTIGLLQ